MDIIDIYNKLNEFSYIYDKDDTKQLIFEDSDLLTKYLTDLDILHDNRNGRIFLEKENLPFVFFIDEKEFENQLKKKDLDQGIIVANYKNQGSLIYFNDTTTIDGSIVETYLIRNAKAYFESIEFFKKQHKNHTRDFEFVDYYSEASKTIVFSSLTEQRRLKLEFNTAGIIKLDESVDFYSKFIEFKNEYVDDTKQFPLFLKNSLISNLVNESQHKYKLFFTLLDKIITDAKINFNVYLQGLSLDKIKTEYKEYKQKYFSNQNTILNKISTQILALPLSIASSAFAIYKLQEEFWAILILCIGLIAFVLYMSHIIMMHWRDLLDVEKEMNYDFDILRSLDFFKKHEGELVHFKSIKDSLDIRIKNLRIGLKFFNFLVWLLDMALIVYALHFMINGLDIIQYLIIIIVLAGVFVYVDVYYLFVESGKEDIEQ